jgi:group I intron endonuclease
MINAHIYLVTNKLNGKQYVGQTTVARNKVGHGLIVTEAYKKHKKENFNYEPICKNINNRNILNFIERFWIKVINSRFPNGYNIEAGGSNKGIVAESTKQKLREANLGKKLSVETKAKIALFSAGRYHSEETKVKLKIARSKQVPPMLGKTTSEETKEKIRKTKLGSNNPMYGKSITDEHRAKLKANSAKNKPWLGKKFTETQKAHLSMVKVCPHCSKVGKGNAMIRYHMDNCKFKEQSCQV